MEFGHPKYLVAQAANMPNSRLSEYSLGRRPIPPHHLLSLCEVLKCSPDEIQGEIDLSDATYKSRDQSS